MILTFSVAGVQYPSYHAPWSHSLSCDQWHHRLAPPGDANPKDGQTVPTREKRWLRRLWSHWGIFVHDRGFSEVQDTILFLGRLLVCFNVSYQSIAVVNNSLGFKEWGLCVWTEVTRSLMKELWLLTWLTSAITCRQLQNLLIISLWDNLNSNTDFWAGMREVSLFLAQGASPLQQKFKTS